MPDQSTKLTDKPTVFISYSHVDETWKNRLRPHLGALEKAGRIAIWDDRKIDTGDTWYPEIKTAMELAAVAVCLISADFLNSAFCVKEEVPYFLQRRERDGLVIIPVLLRPCAWRAITWLEKMQMLPRDYKSVSADFKDDWDTVFAAVAERVFEIIDNPDYKPPAPPAPAWEMPEKIDIARMPSTGSDLFGRAEELKLLDEAWTSPQTNLLSFIAWGGVGKSTLVNKWLERMKADNYRGARRVYAWSFYSQGTSERATSADQFINAALEWFGDENPLAGSPWDKGERLAQLVRQEKTLLLLDGMEPLQSPHHHERGKIKDPALATLVEELARENDGLCVITTREQIADIAEAEFRVPPLGGNATDKDSRLKAVLKTPVQQINLELLSPEAGRALLRVGGVRGTDEELEQATKDFGCHALALNLLAAYLQDIPGHPISAAAQIPDLDVPEAEGKHPRRVIAAFERKFGEGPEVEVLRLLGLFDRPADGASIAALRKAPKIPKLTDTRAKATWLQAVQRLRKYKLIAPESNHDSDELDAHPVVREHFRQQMKRDHPDAWREANLRLYEHLTTTTKEWPDTVEEMSPLFAAMAHGCEAGRYQEALDDVYRRRIFRDDYFNTSKLGAHSTDLSSLAGFFAEPWWKIAAGLTEDSESLVLNQVSLNLRALGKLKESVQPLLTGLQTHVSKEAWVDAAISAINLSELYLTMGEVRQSLKVAQQSVDMADRSGNSFCRMAGRAVLADALHQAGWLPEAEAAFCEAEALQKQYQSFYPLLHSVRGFWYCDLLLRQRKFKEVRDRAMQALVWANQQGSLLTIAMEHLSMGRACLLQMQQHGAGTYAEAVGFVQGAVNGLRQADDMSHLPRGLLARAELRRVTGEYQRAHADLDEAMRIAERSQMRLHLTDCHLERARLCLAQGDRDKASNHWATAKAMIEQIGYHRRDRDLEEIARELA
ncbi:MAG: toll/interleukin-1 receptor domain-containing protein [Acidobacteriota bacterium]|nr:toll/interleukin-1 receptor domain-containing protein [Acidobacteriota bacterium]